MVQPTVTVTQPIVTTGAAYGWHRVGLCTCLAHRRWPWRCRGHCRRRRWRRRRGRLGRGRRGRGRPWCDGAVLASGADAGVHAGAWSGGRRWRSWASGPAGRGQHHHRRHYNHDHHACVSHDGADARTRCSWRRLLPIRWQHLRPVSGAARRCARQVRVLLRQVVQNEQRGARSCRELLRQFCPGMPRAAVKAR